MKNGLFFYKSREKKRKTEKEIKKRHVAQQRVYLTKRETDTFTVEFHDLAS